MLRLLSVLATVFAALLTLPAPVSAGPTDGGGGDGPVTASRLPIVTGSAEAFSRVTTFAGISPYVTLDSFNPYGTNFGGGVRVALGDVNRDGRSDIVTGSGPGVPAHVKVFNGATGATIKSLLPYGATFTGGVFVASADIDGDGRTEVVTGDGSGIPAQVKVFDGGTLRERRSFLPYGNSFTGGVFVAAGDVDGNGEVDIVTGSGPGIPAQVKVFDENLRELRSFLPNSRDFTAAYPSRSVTSRAMAMATSSRATGRASWLS